MIIKKNVIDYKNHNILFIYTFAILRAKRICKYINNISIS